MNLIDYIVSTYVFIDDLFKKFASTTKLRQRGFQPKLSDSEVITMEIVGEHLGLTTDTAIYQYFKRHWLHFFPAMPDRSNFVRQSSNLWHIKQRFFKYLIQYKDTWIQIIDSMPIEVCKFVRAPHTKLFKGTANFGKWCKQTFFGYRLHLKINSFGMIHNFFLTPASYNDITFTEPLLANDRGGWVVADKGYRSQPLHDRLWQERHLYFHTSLRCNEKKASPLPQQTIRKLTGIRRLIETVAGQLEEQFSIKKTKARDLWHLINRITRKILSHTLGVYMNLNLNRNPLHLKSLVA